MVANVTYAWAGITTTQSFLAAIVTYAWAGITTTQSFPAAIVTYAWAGVTTTQYQSVYPDHLVRFHNTARVANTADHRRVSDSRRLTSCLTAWILAFKSISAGQA
jgi:hypothetical protein